MNRPESMTKTRHNNTKVPQKIYRLGTVSKDIVNTHARTPKVLSEGVQFFMSGWRIRIPHNGPSLPARETAFKWRFAEVRIMAKH